MHILHIPSWFETPSRPTAGKAVKDLALALSLEGISNTIFFQTEFELPEIQYAEGFRIFYCHYKESLVDKLLMGGNALNVFSKKANKLFDTIGRPDIIHAHGFKALIYAYRLYKEHSVPFIYTEHSFIPRSGIKNRVKRKVISRILPFSSANIAVSRFLASALNDRNVKFDVIPNCIDFNVFTYVPEKKDHLIMINLFTKNKQIEKGIELFQWHQRYHPNSQLYLIGDGPEKQKLLGKYSSDKIIFLGEKNYKDWLPLLQSARSLLLMSKSETFGVVIVEALASGTPVICLDNGGVQDILAALPPNQRVLQVFPLNASIDLLHQSLRSNNVNLSQELSRTREHLKKAFDYSVIAEKYIRVYSMVINK